MFLKEYINNIKTDNDFFKNKSWLNTESLIEHFEEKKIPSSASEEWKNFRTTELSQINWEIPKSNREIIIKEEVKKIKNSIILRNGFFDSELSTFSDQDGINVNSIEAYLQKNPDFIKSLYNNPSKYAENRLSGLCDEKPTSLLSLNALLNNGIVVEIEAKKKISETINIVNASYSNKEDLLINPYIILICNDGSEVDIKEVYFNNNCWTNAFLEAYIEPSANLSFSRVQKSMNNSIKTASFNCHLKKDSKLNLKVYNRERSKEDIRIFLKEENACANVSGIVVSSAKEESDIFCKIVHEASLTNSDQKWRLLSAEKSKTSINGKIRVNKGAKKSNASFSSKSLILDKGASSFSKPELEILEDDVKCKHGAAFGEIDKNTVFFMQSRGIKKEDAIIMLVYAFINEISNTAKFFHDDVVKEVEKFFEKVNVNE